MDRPGSWDFPYAEMMASTHDAICVFDLDGTLAGYDERMREDYEKLRSPSEAPLLHPHGQQHLPYVKARIAMIRLQPDWWLNLTRHQPGFDVLGVARELNFENHALTKGPRSNADAWAQKVRWCDREAPDLLVNIGQKKSLFYAKVLVEDWGPYFMPWLEVRPRGLVVVIDQPWNQDISHPNIVRYDGTNLDEVRERMTVARDSVRREK